MRNDFELLLWLYSMGVENVPSREPINYFDEQIKNKANDSLIQDPHAFKEKKKIREPESEKLLYETFKKEISEIENINVLEEYWCDTLTNIFNVKKFWRLNKVDEQKKLNILIIHEPPTSTDFAQYSSLDGKKRSLIDNILFAILSGESEKKVQNIFCPILPIPLNNAIQFEDIQSFYLMFLSNLIRILKPSLVLLVGDRAISYLSPNIEANDQVAERENHYFSIPELAYMMSVPEVKRTVWQKWKQKRRTIKNDLFL